MMRNKLFTQPSVKEIQMSRAITTIETTHDNKSNKFEKALRLHYTHEERLHPLKRDIHKIYAEVFQGTAAANIRLVVGHRNSRNLQAELIQKRPHSSFVKLKPLQSKIFLSHYDQTFLLKNLILVIIEPYPNDSSRTN